MIKLTPVPQPAALTPALVAQLTQEFINTDKTVWKGNGIEEALLAMSNNKCCYCECRIDEESKYLEVEHFCHKNKYKQQVLLWSNLLPSCKRCNGTKNDHDVLVEPIINPSIDNPQDHLSFRAYRIHPKTTLGDKTIEVINLNHRQRLVRPRFDIGDELIDKLNNLLELSIDYDNEKSQHTRRKNIIVNTLESLLEEAIPSSEYAATTATVLLNNDSYQKTKAIFVKQHLWTPEFQALEDQAKSCALDLK